MATFKTMGQQFHQQFLGTAPEVGTEFVREKQGYTLRYLFTQGQFCSGLLETDGSQLGFETVFLCSTFFTPVVIGGITYTYLLQVQLQWQAALLNLQFQFFKFRSVHYNKGLIVFASAKLQSNPRACNVYFFGYLRLINTQKK